MGANLRLWSLEYRRDYHRPKDIDIELTEPGYSDLELYGERWDSYCNPEAIQYNQTFTSNNGNPLERKQYLAYRWLPLNGGIIPNLFIPKTYKVIIYDNANRGSILKTITGSIHVNDLYLLDQYDWFVSKIINVTPSKSLNINTTENIFVDVLQPEGCDLLVEVHRPDQGGDYLFNETNVSNQVRQKRYNKNYTFTQTGTYRIIYSVTTPANRWIDEWCEAQNDYIETDETVINIS